MITMIIIIKTNRTQTAAASTSNGCLNLGMTLNTIHRNRSVAIVCHEQNKDDFKSYEIHFLTQQHTAHMRHNVYCCVVKIQNVEHVQQLTPKKYGTRKMPFPRLTFLKQAASKGAKRYLYLALS